MTVNGLHLLLAAAAAGLTWSIYTRTRYARRRRIDHVRDRVGGAIVAGYYEGIRVWTNGDPRPVMPTDLVEGHRPEWLPTMPFDERHASAQRLEIDAYAWAAAMAWEHAHYGVTPPAILPGSTARYIERVRQRRKLALAPMWQTLREELDRIGGRGR